MIALFQGLKKMVVTHLPKAELFILVVDNRILRAKQQMDLGITNLAVRVGRVLIVKKMNMLNNNHLMAMILMNGSLAEFPLIENMFTRRTLMIRIGKVKRKHEEENENLFIARITRIMQMRFYGGKDMRPDEQTNEKQTSAGRVKTDVLETNMILLSIRVEEQMSRHGKVLEMI